MKSATSSSIGTLGEKISFVTLDNIIGKPGEQGEAWKAHSNSHTTLNFAVKIGRIPLKVLPKNGTAKLEEFRKEFDMLAKLNHPNIIKVYHYGGYKKNSKVYPFYIMEYLGDNVKTLTAYLKDLINPAEKRRLCLNVFFDISDALKHLHIKHHGVHSDIKESNILIATDYDKNVNIKLIDFGFARVLGAAEASEDRLGRIGRVPQKPSSLPRVAPCKTVHHMDIWQLCQTISRNLSHKPIEVNEATELWPIDYADFPLLIGLIKDWASDAPASAPETDTIENFFNKVDALRCRVKPKYCDADLRGSLRFLSIPEVATAVV